MNAVDPDIPFKNLFIGGLVAMGFDDTGSYLLVVSHSGRGVYEAHNWERIARDLELAYPKNGIAIGIGPVAGHSIKVLERNEIIEVINLNSPEGDYRLRGESDGITIYNLRSHQTRPQ